MPKERCTQIAHDVGNTARSKVASARYTEHRHVQILRLVGGLQGARL